MRQLLPFPRDPVDPAVLCSDPDLEALHSHPDFRRWLDTLYDRGFPSLPFASDPPP